MMKTRIKKIIAYLIDQIAKGVVYGEYVNVNGGGVVIRGALKQSYRERKEESSYIGSSLFIGKFKMEARCENEMLYMRRRV